MWDDDEATALYHLLDTEMPEGQREITMTAGEGRVDVVDTQAGSTTVGGPAAAAGDGLEGANGDVETIDSLLVLSAPTVAESDKMVKQMLESLPRASSGTEWEEKVSRVLVEQSRGRAKLASLATKQDMSTVEAVSSRTLYKLHLLEDFTDVLVPAISDRDVQAVYEKPSYDSKKLGVEQRSVIEVEEEKDGWLRYRPRASDKQQCWVVQSSGNGRWELAPVQSSAALQLEFFVESSLELLMFALTKEADVSDVLLNCCRRFAGRLVPLALFESAGNIIEKSLDALISWLTERVTASGEAASDVVGILVQLALAHGSLSAILQLAEFLSAHPDLLTSEILIELNKLSEVEGFELAARLLFRPPAGSLEQFAAEWKQHVLPAVRKAGQPEAEIMAKVREGDGEAAEELIRAILSEKTFSALRIPNLRRLKESKDARQFAALNQQLQQQVHRFSSKGMTVSSAAAGVLALVFSHVEVASLRMEPSTRDRAPICVDVGVTDSLVQLLSTHCSVLALIGADDEASARRDLCASLLRLLSLNISHMVASRTGPLSESCAATLQSILTSILEIDPTKHPECSKLAEPAADLFGVSQQFLLSSAASKIDAVKDLAAKLLAPVPALTLEPVQTEEVGGKLSPLTVQCAAELEGCVVVSPGLIKLPDEKSVKEGAKFLCHKKMSGGEKNYLEVRQAETSSSKPTEENPQGFDILIGIAASDCDINSPVRGFDAKETLFHPVSGLTVSVDASGAPQPGSLEGLGEWWKSPKSVCAGDTCGLYLDTGTGELIALKNGKPIGTIHAEQPEGTEWSWVIGADPNPGLHLEVFGAVVSSVDDCARLIRDEPPSNLSSAAIVERLGAAVVGEMAKASALKAILPVNGSIDALGCLVDLLAHKALSGDHSSDASQLSGGTRADKNTWTWGKKHSTFRTSKWTAVSYCVCE